MAIIKAISSKASIGVAINYITKKEKTNENLISGINCNPVCAIDEMKFTKQCWNKNGGRQYKHFVISYSKDENLTHEKAHKLAIKLMREFYNEFEVLLATHTDREHIHTHVVINSVSYIDGQKIQQSSKDLQRLKDRSDEICREYGLSVCQKHNRVQAYDMNKYKVLQKISKGKMKSYVYNTFVDVKKAKRYTKSKEEFIGYMNYLGYKVIWKDNRKYITFIDKDGNKVRNNNIEKTFQIDLSKEKLLENFENKKQIYQKKNEKPENPIEEYARRLNKNKKITYDFER